MPTAIDTKLPKLNGIDQASHITQIDTKKNNKKNEDFTETLAFKLAMHELTNPPIDQLLGEGKGGNNAQATIGQIIATAEQTAAINEMKEEISSLAQSNRRSQSLQAFQLQGKEVYCNDDTRNLTKDDTEVQYSFDLKYGQSAPDDAKAVCNIEITNDKGDVVYTTKRDGVSGNNKFNWNGRDSSGKRVEPGDYKINVSALFSKKSEYGAIEVSTLKGGTVEEVVIDGEKIKLRINGELVDFDNAIKIGLPKINNDIAKPSVHEIMNYINKQVEVDTSQLYIQNGTGEVLYDNDIQNTGKVRIDILDSNSKYIKTIISNQKLNCGQGSFIIDARAENIPDGNYKVDIRAEDMDDDNRLKAVKNDKVLVDVDAVDVAQGRIKSGKQSFDARSIVNNLGESNLYTLGSQLIGKDIQYQDNNFEFSNNHTFDIAFKEPTATRKAGNARLEIYKDDILVVSKDIAPVQLEPVPAFDQLNGRSKLIVDYFIKNEMAIPGKENYASLDNKEQLVANKYIKEQFRLGSLFGQDQDITDPQTLAKNTGISKVDWNGKLDDNSSAKLGDTYRYEVYSSTTNLDGSDTKETREIALSIGFVTKPIIENNHLILELAGGQQVPLEKILDIRSSLQST